MKNLLEPDNYDLKKGFDYPPMKKSIEMYKERANARWAKVSKMAKRALTNWSLVAVLGLVVIKCQYA